MALKPVKPDKTHFFIVEDDKGRKEVILKKIRYSIGRTQKADIRINSPFVSRHHATLFKIFNDDGHEYYRIVDGDGRGKLSSNGLIINGRKAYAHDLKNGDRIVFGPQVIAVYQHSQRDIFPSMPPDDPFDITLIDPAMMVNEFEEG